MCLNMTVMIFNTEEKGEIVNPKLYFLSTILSLLDKNTLTLCNCLNLKQSFTFFTTPAIMQCSLFVFFNITCLSWLS